MQRKGQYLTKMRRIVLFIGLSDGEVMKKHLTRDPTNAPTIHLHLPRICFLSAVATQGSVASYMCHLALLPFGEAGRNSQNGEVLGEMSGGVFAEHLTIQTLHE